MKLHLFILLTFYALSCSALSSEQLEHKALRLAREYKKNPTNTTVIIDLANTLNKLDRDIESMELYLKILEMHPHCLNALYNFGFTLKKQGRFDQAIKVYDKVLEQKSDYAPARFSRAHALLATGDFKRGWQEYEWRWQAYDESPRKFNVPIWDGSSIEGKRILVYAEQGLGDTLQFIRYAQLLKKDGAIVVVETQSPLAPLLSLCPYIDELYERSDTIPFVDVHIPLMSLPRIYETRLNTIPNAMPYLHADEQLIDYWRDYLSHDPHFKIGICWQGNANYSTESLRRTVAKKSLPLNILARITTIPGVSVYNLQHIHGTEQLNSLETSGKIHCFGPEFDELNGRFMDTAAIIKNLDLVITVDTSIAHLSGALGTPTWILLQKVADWRWLQNRTNSPWYPTAQLFRQTTFGDWDGVIDDVCTALKERVNNKQHNDVCKKILNIIDTTLRNSNDSIQSQCDYLSRTDLIHFRNI